MSEIDQRPDDGPVTRDRPWQLPLVFELPWPLELLQRAQGSGFWDWDIRGGRLLRSDGWLVLYGREPVPADEPFEISDWVSWLHPDDRAPADRALRELFGSEDSVWRRQFRVVWPDGSVRILRSVGTVERNRDGVPIRMIGIDRDITEELRNQQALAASEERFQLAVEATRDAIFDWDLRTDEFHFTDRAIDLFGRRPTTLIEVQEMLARCVPRTDVDSLAESFRAALSGGQLFDVTFRFRHPGGRNLWLRSRGKLLRDEEDVGIRMTGAITDVTEEFQLRRMARLTERAATVGGWEVDPETQQIHWSPGVFLMFDRDPADGLPDIHYAIDYYDVEDGSQARVQEAVGRAIEEGTPFDLDLTAHTEKGRRIQVQVNGRVEVLHGRTHRIYGAIQDVTQRRELEAQLLHAQKLESVGRLAGGIAHDFNNLLTVITAAAELADSGDAGLEDEIRMIRDAARRGSELTRQLLTFARREESSAEPLSVTDLLESLSPLLQKALGESIELRVNSASGPILVLADPSRLEQVVMNLAVNARDAMPDGGRLEIDLDTVDLPERGKVRDLPPGRYARLRVTDDGVGIPEELRVRIFEPFFTTKAVGSGSGLGLSTCFGIIRSSRGTIEVNPAEPCGTCFTVLLPLTDGHQSSRVHAATTEPTRSRGHRFLVVEDEDPVRRVIARVLESDGNVVLQASDPLEAVELASDTQTAPDALITDIRMPGGNGIDLALKLQSRWPELRVLLISGYSDELSPSTLQDERTRFLPKPFGPEELRAALSTLIAD